MTHRHSRLSRGRNWAKGNSLGNYSQKQHLSDPPQCPQKVQIICILKSDRWISTGKLCLRPHRFQADSNLLGYQLGFWKSHPGMAKMGFLGTPKLQKRKPSRTGLSCHSLLDPCLAGSTGNKSDESRSLFQTEVSRRKYRASSLDPLNW